MAHSSLSKIEGFFVWIIMKTFFPHSRSFRTLSISKMQTRSQTLNNIQQSVASRSNKGAATTKQTRRSQRLLHRDSMGIPRVDYAELADEKDEVFDLNPAKSQSTSPTQRYEVEIDFDEASRAWRANKRLIGQGHFAYRTQEKHNIRKEVIEHVERRSARLAEKSAASYV